MTIVKDLGIFTVTILCLASLATRSYADVEIRVCNETDENIYLSVAGFDKEAPTLQWMSRGWFMVVNGQCGNINIAEFMPQHLFWYANNATHTKNWRGKFLFCVRKIKAFRIKGDRNCNGYEEDYTSKGFHHKSKQDGSYYIGLILKK